MGEGSLELLDRATMSGNPQSALLKRRTHAMAWVILTDRDDLTVMDVGDDAGIDLLVLIRKDKVRAMEQFGVILQGTVERGNTPLAACQILNAMMPKGRGFESIYLPICIFFFSMVGDRGYYAWLYEPVESDGLPKLRRRAKLECKRLDPGALEDIIRNVDHYYDALSKSLIS
jgi:hypothetical protein